MKITAQIVAIECACGGSFFDSRTGSYDITSDTHFAHCGNCDKTIDLNSPMFARRKASLFV